MSDTYIIHSIFTYFSLNWNNILAVIFIIGVVGGVATNPPHRVPSSTANNTFHLMWVISGLILFFVIFGAGFDAVFGGNTK